MQVLRNICNSVLIIVIGVHLTQAAVFCPIDTHSNPAINVDEEVSPSDHNSSRIKLNYFRTYYQCPGPKDAPELTECCPEGAYKCCLSSMLRTKNVHESDFKWVYILISSLCLLFSIILVICCFWSRCPLHNSCSVRYTRDDAGCADKMGEIPVFNDSLPAENSPLGNTLVIAHSIKDDSSGEKKAREVAV